MKAGRIMITQRVKGSSKNQKNDEKDRKGSLDLFNP
jgi:hypothetical protein